MAVVQRPIFPKEVQVLISRMYAYVILHSKSDLADVIKPKISRQGDYSELSRYAQCNHKSP